MKKTIILSLVAGVVLAIGCTKEEHAGKLTITSYPDFDLAEGSVYAYQVGSDFVDPGFTATLNGEDVSKEVEVVGKVDGKTPGVYSLTYVFTNSEGFVSTVSRTVVVYDIANANSTDIAGTYNTKFTRNPGLANEYVYNKNALKITNGPGKGLFYMQDLLAGFYSIGYGYGEGYTFKAFIQLNADNSISVLSINDPGSMGTKTSACSYDPSTESVSISWWWGGWNVDIVTVYSK